jgi:RecB family exonuclease
LTRSEREGGTPTVPSRWLARLENALPEGEFATLKARGETWRQAAARRDEPAGGGGFASARPAPKPPLTARPRKLSVTEIETLQINPYAIYAKRVLGLRRLDDIDADAGAAERGTFTHRALQIFLDDWPDKLPAGGVDAVTEKLVEIGRGVFRPVAATPGLYAFWWPRFVRVARWVAEAEIARRAALSPLGAECRGEMVIEAPGGPFTLNGIADRVDLRAADNGLVIVDYKTGGLPTGKDQTAGFAPQLPLLAAMAEVGGFKDIGPGQVMELAYWRLTGGDPVGEAKTFVVPAAEAAEEALKGLKALIPAGPIARARWRGVSRASTITPTSPGSRNGRPRIPVVRVAKDDPMTVAPNPSSGADATAEQRKAADTGASVWVGASAGTGKTKVLTDRVLSLLLARTPPQRILCLTFTRAAAAEMANRVREALGKWAIAGEDKLAQNIEELTGNTPDPELSAHARGLFGAVLDCPGGLKIQTIHAFCESLLRRFPVEAGVHPHFQLMDDRTARELLTLAGDEVLARAMDEAGAGEEEGVSGRGGRFASALGAIAGDVNTEAFHKLMDRLANDRARLSRMLDRCGGLPGAAEAIAARLNVDPRVRREDLIAAACTDSAFDGTGLRDVLTVMDGGLKTDKERAARIAPFLAADSGARTGLMDDYRRGFFTSQGKVYEQPITKGTLKNADDPDALLEIMAVEAARLMALDGRLNSLANYHTSVAAVTLGAALVAAYGTHKHARARLDYEDLILKTRDLLEGGGAAQWVLFKLDGGLDHILVDEAQDTSPDQWGVIKALAEEFFAGHGAREALRTVFAVGDAKQSIYSFQRADPRAFEEMRAFFRARAEDAAAGWRDVDLHVSFRSTAAVLDAVDTVFADPEARQGLGPQGTEILHRPDRSGQAGLVELWPLMESDKPSLADPWAPEMDVETGTERGPARPCPGHRSRRRHGPGASADRFRRRPGA